LSWLTAAWDWYSFVPVGNGAITYPHAALVNPVAAGIGAALLILAALSQARIAARRHYAQTEADRQRRIVESFTKAVEQLGSDKLEVRVGGIFALERLSRESVDDYWTIMEILAAYVRDHMPYAMVQDRISERAYFLWLQAGRPEGLSEEFWAMAVRLERIKEPPTDIAAVLAVIKGRSAENRRREREEDRFFDLSGTYLNRGFFWNIHLEGADFAHSTLRSTGHVSCVLTN
jgi:hypothetical protein